MVRVLPAATSLLRWKVARPSHVQSQCCTSLTILRSLTGGVATRSAIVAAGRCTPRVDSVKAILIA
jgi:hypothetical protein